MGRAAWSLGYLAGIFLLLSREELGGNIIMAGKMGKGRGEVTSPQLKQSVAIVIKELYVKVGRVKVLSISSLNLAHLLQQLPKL
jgi:hypothetical protein